MIGGQYLDVTTDGELDAAGLKALHRLKTGRLLRASVTTAAAAAGLGEGARKPWQAFGDEIGLLFQIVDDILDARATTSRSSARRLARTKRPGRSPTSRCTGSSAARALADDARVRVHERLAGLPGDTSVLATLVETIRDRSS